MDNKFILNSENPQNDFTFFIENTEKITYYNKGTFEIIFILELRGDVDTPYKYKNNSTIINKIILKIVGLRSDENHTKKNIRFYTKNNKKNYNSETLTVDVIKKECTLQNMVYDCGEKYGIQMCPKMCYCENIMEKEKIHSFIQKLIENCGYTPPPPPTKLGMIRNLFIKPVKPVIPETESYTFFNGLSANLEQIDGLSVSLMEYAEGYKELWRNNSYSKNNFARISLLRLALFCNISHTDPTYDNILVNNNNHILLLGFGSTIDDEEKISDNEKNTIIDELKKENYEQSLKLCNKMFVKNNVELHHGSVLTPIEWVHSVNIDDNSQLKPLVSELLTQYNNKLDELLQPENLQKGGNKKNIALKHSIKKHSIKKHSIKKHSIKKHSIKKHSIKKHIIKNKT